jgi:hypothetical protein
MIHFTDRTPVNAELRVYCQVCLDYYTLRGGNPEKYYQASSTACPYDHLISTLSAGATFHITPPKKRRLKR